MGIRAGDHVLHGPTGEKWVVAWVDGDRMSWAGWPPKGAAMVADCTLVKAASDEEHIAFLNELAKGVGTSAAKAKAELARPDSTSNTGGEE